MTLSNWLQRLRSGRMNCKATGRRRRVARTAAVALESLEPRVLLSADSGVLVLSFSNNQFDAGTGSLNLFVYDSNGRELSVTVDPETDHVLVNGNTVNALGFNVPLEPGVPVDIPLLGQDVRSISVTGGIGPDTIDLSGVTREAFTNLESVRVDGGAGHDLIIGSEFDDVLIGGTGNDTILGGDGNDRIFGGVGRDQLYGEDGNDRLRGQANSDTLKGGDGNDRLFGGGGRDFLRGDNGSDLLKGQANRDTLHGQAFDDDTLIGGQSDNEGDSIWSVFPDIGPLTGDPQTGVGETIDLGEFYWYQDEQISLLRSQDQIVVEFRDASLATASIERLTGEGGILEGWDVLRSEGHDRVRLVRNASTAPVPEFDLIVAADPNVEWAVPVYSGSESNGWLYVGDELVVRLNPGESPEEFFAGLGTYRRLSTTNDQFILTAPGVSGAGVLLLADELHGDPRIVWASPDFWQDFSLF